MAPVIPGLRESAVLEAQPPWTELQPLARIDAASGFDQHVVDPPVGADDQIRFDSTLGGLEHHERPDAAFLRKLHIHLPALAVAQVGLDDPFASLELHRADPQGLALELRGRGAEGDDGHTRFDRRESRSHEKRPNYYRSPRFCVHRFTSSF